MSVFSNKIKVKEQALDIVSVLALSTLGHYVAKNNPDYIDDMESWYSEFQKALELNDLQEMFKHAVDTLVEKFTDDKFIQTQVTLLLDMLDITIEGPEELDDVLKYRKIIDAFMSGVATVK